jgi:23S rRNA (guanine745-N1)-methyltransferase
MFRCPVCAASLHTEGGSRRCSGGHVFDIAREGYVNLLAGRSARHRRAGDDAEMIKARRLFIDAGHYEPLRDAVLARVGDGAVLDVGCGEGYYTRPLADGHDGWVGGIDLS